MGTTTLRVPDELKSRVAALVLGIRAQREAGYRQR